MTISLPYLRDNHVENFRKWLNAIHPSIKFVGSFNRNQINFLDTYVYRNVNNHLAFKVYRKPTDKNALLHYSSCHSRRLVNNIPFGQYLRLKHNSSLPADFHKEELLLSNQLKSRGYPLKVIQKAKEKTLERDRGSLLEDCPLIRKNRITCGLEYNHLLEPIRRLIYLRHLIKHIPGCKELPFVGLRRTRCLKDMLVHLDLTVMRDQSTTEYNNRKEHKACRHCTSCEQIWREKPVLINGYEIKLKHSTTYASKSTIYTLKCKCAMLYIGSCRRALRIRICEHRSRIRNRNIDAPLVMHFIDKNHTPDDFQFTVLEQLKINKYNRVNLHKLLLQRECFWIHKLNTLIPSGLNNENELNCFLG